MKKIVAKTVAQAEKAEGIGTTYNYKLAASLFDSRGRLIKCRTNTYKTHPVMAKYGGELKNCLHAEAHVLVATGLDRCSGLNMLVIRTLKNGELTMAKPCTACADLIRDCGIETVYYSTWEGTIEKEDCI